MGFRNTAIVTTIFCMLILAACGPQPVKPQAEMDTPEHHVTSGYKYLKAGKYDDALREFDRARQLDPKYGPAYLGLGLTSAHQQDYEKALDFVGTAKKYAKGDEQTYDVQVGYMQVYYLGRETIDANWLGEMRGAYSNALRITEERPDAFYYMGLGYKVSYEFRKSVMEFTRVLDLKKGFVAEADREYTLVQKIERAMPGSTVGKKIALLEQITRADLAALFIEELKIDDLYRRKAKRTFDTGFKAPGQSAVPTAGPRLPPDISTHVLKADIEAVIAMGIKGLQPFPDGNFNPDANITRAEYAMIVEDILITITGDTSLATMFIGNKSPFPDLRSDLPYFNAAMVCTSRGILEAVDLGTGEFRPTGVISGADALLSIRALKSQLNQY
ncbi:MAG: S-layer homology domain-containing protein [Pseudomonadota bacterium]